LATSSQKAYPEKYDKFYVTLQGARQKAPCSRKERETEPETNQVFVFN
jgi:hypothetical protein